MRVRLPVLLSLSLMAAAAPAHAQSAAELYYERAVLGAANARCSLFTPDLAAALSASTVQARNTALRAGIPTSTLDATLARAQARAGAAPCDGPDVRTAADRARLAFKAYAGLGAMNFPGDLGDWRAVRGTSVVNSAWRLSQTTHAGLDRMTFGIAGSGGQQYLLAVAAFSDGQTPYAARLVVRDPSRAPTPYIANLAGAAPLYARLPPVEAQKAILAQSRMPAELALLPVGAKQAIAFRFPSGALPALTGLDPREAIAVDFVFAGPLGDAPRRAYFEVGDFAAGLAFLGAGQR
jgi:hypothetical protein